MSSERSKAQEGPCASLFIKLDDCARIAGAKEQKVSLFIALGRQFGQASRCNDYFVTRTHRCLSTTIPPL